MRRLDVLFLAMSFLFGSVPTGAEESPAALAEETLVTDSLWPALKDLPRERRPKVALVLGGGGARGLAHIGVLKVLEREGVPVDLVVGVSVGALVGSLYAAGLPVDRIEGLGRDIGWDDLTNFSSARLVRLVLAEKLLSTRRMEEYLRGAFSEKRFSDLKREFACVAADLKTGEKIVLREGDVALAARASATMPGLFQPVPYRHRLLVDGGLVDNLPVGVASLLGAEVIVAVNVPADLAKHQVSNVLMTMTQALYIQGQAMGEDALKAADVLISPEVKEVTAMELWRSKECIAAGEIAARRALPRLRKALVKAFLKSRLAAVPPAKGSGG